MQSLENRRPTAASRSTRRWILRTLGPISVTVLGYLLARQIMSWPQYQLPLYVGLLLGSVAKDWRDIAAASGLLWFAVLLAPPASASSGTYSLSLMWFALLVVTATGVAGMSLVLARRHAGQFVAPAAALLAFGMLCANMIVTTNFVDTSVPQPPYPALYEFLDEVPAKRAYWEDARVYLRAYHDMAAGRGYYRSYRDAWRFTEVGKDPVGPWWRMPTAFWIWQLQPWGTRGVPLTLLALDLLALAFFTYAVSRYMTPGTAVAGIAGLAAYLLYFPTSVYVLWVDTWAIPFALASMAAVLMAVRSRSRRLGWWWIAAGSALLAMLVREQFLLLGLAGLAAAVVVPEQRARRVWVPWISAVLVFLLAWSVHSSVAASVSLAESPTLTEVLITWFQGGLEFLLAGISYATLFISRGLLGAIAVAVLGLFGILVSPRPIRWFLGLAAAEGTLLLLVFGNRAYTTTGTRLGYWGVFLTPYLLAAIPFALAAFATLGTTEERGRE